MSSRARPMKDSASASRERNEWIAALKELTAQAEKWAGENDWWVHLDSKTIEESMIGSYEAPVLMIRAPAGRLVLDPIARDVVGALGRVDLCAFPSYENAIIVRTPDGWHFKKTEKPDFDQAWSKKAFLKMASDLLATP